MTARGRVDGDRILEILRHSAMPGAADDRLLARGVPIYDHQQIACVGDGPERNANDRRDGK